MKIIKKTCVILILFSCAFTAIAKDIIKEIDFTKNSKDVDDEILGAKIIKCDKAYIVYHFSLKDVKNVFSINIKASARNGAKLGMIIFRTPLNSSKREKIKQYWNVKFPEDKLVSKSFKIEYLKDVKESNSNYHVYLYRSTNLNNS